MNDEIPFWIKFNGNDFPKNAIVGGLYKGEKAYIGRAYHNGALTPGTALESEKVCLIPWVTFNCLQFNSIHQVEYFSGVQGTQKS